VVTVVIGIQHSWWNGNGDGGGGGPSSLSPSSLSPSSLSPSSLSPSDNACGWKSSGFYQSRFFGGGKATISQDNSSVDCASGDSCAVFMNSLPWTSSLPPKASEKCAGTYRYTVLLNECGKHVEQPHSDQNGQVGFLGTVEASWGDFGVWLWAGLGPQSCYTTGWLCGCKGTAPGGSAEAIVTGNVSLSVSINTDTWMINVTATPPAGAMASNRPVPEVSFAANPVPKKDAAADVRPSILLNPGAKMSMLFPANLNMRR
jgi:hypothetical protein